MAAKPKVIHCIGDSHVSLFSGKDEIVPVWNEPHEDLLPQFRTYRLGAMLAYNLATEGHEGRDKLFTCVKATSKTAKVLLCFGEIDCRAHIVKQAQAQDKSIVEIAGLVAYRYFTVVKEIAALRQTIVWGSTPQSAAIHSSNKFPTVGTQEERNEATAAFNAILHAHCKEAGIGWANIFYRIVNTDTMLSDPSYFFDTAHMNQKALPFALEALAPFLS